MVRYVNETALNPCHVIQYGPCSECGGRVVRHKDQKNSCAHTNSGSAQTSETLCRKRDGQPRAYSFAQTQEDFSDSFPQPDTTKTQKEISDAQPGGDTVPESNRNSKPFTVAASPKERRPERDSVA